MLFDVQAALAEILNGAPEAAIPAIPAIRRDGIAEIAGIAAQPAEIPAPAEVLPFPPQPAPSRQEAETFPHGLCRLTGCPRTWTGRIVSLEEWRRLSTWDRHGSTDKLFCGICRAWVAENGGCPHSGCRKGGAA